MPVHETEDGKWQFGTTGKEYSSRAKAIKQGLAIVYSQAKKQGRETPSRDLIQREVFGKSSISKKAAEYFTPEELKPEDAPFDPSPFWMQTTTKLGPDAEPVTLATSKEVRKAVKPFSLPYTTAEGKRTMKTALDLDVPAMGGARKAMSGLRWANSPLGRGKVTEGELSEKRTIVEDALKDLTQERRIAMRLARGKVDMETLKVLGPSYLGFGIAGMLIGRMISGKKKKWWGYGLGAAAGLGLNFLRRKYSYGGNIVA